MAFVIGALGGSRARCRLIQETDLSGRDGEGAWITAALACIVGGGVGGGFKLAGVEIPILESLVVQLGLVVLGVLFLVAGARLSKGLLAAIALVGLALPVLSATFADGGPTTTIAPAVSTSTPKLPVRTTATSPAVPSTGVTPTALVTTIPKGCVIEIKHFAAELKEEPTHRSRTISSVPETTYIPRDIAQTEFAGRDEQWFQIEVDGRVGWIWDDPIILTKNSDCP